MPEYSTRMERSSDSVNGFRPVDLISALPGRLAVLFLDSQNGMNWPTLTWEFLAKFCLRLLYVHSFVRAP